MENAEIVPASPQNIPENKRYTEAPLISEILKKERLSPKRIGEIASQYRQAGIVIEEQNRPNGFTELHTDGRIRVAIPHIAPYGNDSVALHEFFHIEQFLRAFQSGLTPTEIGSTPPHDIVTAEIGALEGQLNYLKRIPLFALGFRPLRHSPAYKDFRRKVQILLEARKHKLPKGYKPSEEDKLNPYKKVVDL